MRAIGTLLMMRAWRKKNTTGPMYHFGRLLYR